MNIMQRTHKRNVVQIVTERVDLLSVRVLYGKAMEEKSIISVHTVQVVYEVSRLVSLAAPRIDVGSLRGLSFF
jgi:hypothetical protein